jgi:heme A synthase
MARIAFELSGFFLLPFLAYAAFLIWKERHPRAAKAILTKKALQIQALIGVAFVTMALLVAALLEQPHKAGYSPAIFKDGKLVPGRVE